MPLDATKWTRVNCTDSHSYLHSPILSCLCVHDISVSKKMLQVFSTQQHEGRFYQSAVFPVTIIRHLTFHHKLSYMYDFFTSPHPPPPTPTKTNKQTYKKHTMTGKGEEMQYSQQSHSHLLLSWVVVQTSHSSVLPRCIYPCPQKYTYVCI